MKVPRAIGSNRRNENSERTVIIVVYDGILFVSPAHLEKIHAHRRSVRCGGADDDGGIVVDAETAERAVPVRVILLFVESNGKERRYLKAEGAADFIVNVADALGGF